MRKKDINRNGRRKLPGFVSRVFGPEWFLDTLVEFVGSFFIAVAIVNFAVPAGFPMTGFSGIAIIINRFTGLYIGAMTAVLNIPIAILCYKLIGRNFFFRSLRCILISSLMTDYLAVLLPCYEGNRAVAAACTGVIGGIGYAMIYMRNSSTGGSDFIVMALKAKFQHIKLGRLIFITDALVVVAGGILLKDFDGIIYGLAVNFLFGYVADKMMYGLNSGRLALVVTDYPAKLNDEINEACSRGTTIIRSYGGHTGNEHSLLMCACSSKDIVLVENAVKKADPKAFTVILESSEVLGEGFSHVHVAESERHLKGEKENKQE